MRLVTWNVAGTVGRQAERAAVLAALAADVVALQQITARAPAVARGARRSWADRV